MRYTPDTLIVDDGIRSKPSKPVCQVTEIGLATSSINWNGLKKKELGEGLESVIGLLTVPMKLK